MAKTKQTPCHNPTDTAKAKTKSGNQSSNRHKQNQTLNQQIWKMMVTQGEEEGD